MSTFRDITETATELGKDAKEAVEEFGRSAGKRMDAARDETGDALHAAASSVRSTGRQGSETIDHLTTSAADRLDSTASFVEDHDLGDVFNAVRRFGRRHLAGALVSAAAVGFVAGSALSRAAHSCRKSA